MTHLTLVKCCTIVFFSRLQFEFRYTYRIYVIYILFCDICIYTDVADRYSLASCSDVCCSALFRKECRIYYDNYVYLGDSIEALLGIAAFLVSDGSFYIFI